MSEWTSGRQARGALVLENPEAAVGVRHEDIALERFHRRCHRGPFRWGGEEPADLTPLAIDVSPHFTRDVHDANPPPPEPGEKGTVGHSQAIGPRFGDLILRHLHGLLQLCYIDRSNRSG